MSLLTKLRKILSRKAKFQLLALLIGIIFGAFLEMLALSIISPFIAVLMEPSQIFSNQILSFIYHLLGFQGSRYFLAFLAFALAFVYIFRGGYMLLLNKVQFGYVAKQQIFLSNRILEKVLGRSYLYHAGKNLAEMQRMITLDVNQMFVLIKTMLYVVSDVFMTGFILGFLFLVSVRMTLSVLCLSGVCVFVHLKFFRKEIRKAGVENRTQNVAMVKVVNESLGAIKDLKILHREEYFLKGFKRAGDRFIVANQRANYLNALPKSFIETVCFGGAFILIGFMIVRGTDMQAIVPQLSLFVLAAFRMLPAVARMNTSVGQVLFLRSSLDAVYRSLFEEDAQEERYSDPEININVTADSTEDITVDVVTDAAENIAEDVDQEVGMRGRGTTQGIVVRDVTFQYPGAVEPILQNASCIIPESTSVAFVGPSGAGKTTLVDMILGIYTPKEGFVSYDGYSVHHHRDKWCSQLGYIPQQIYLLDDTIINNVALGIDKEEIDNEQIWRALGQAQLKSFVESLPEGLDTIVGDRGVKLSGGQRQRIGIARALYNDPPILVLDEATSSLDNETEKAVMEAIHSFQGKKTMIIVAHRLSTIENCDIIYEVRDKGIICSSR